MNPYSIQCPTCQTRLKVRSADAIDQILACPKCGGMVLVTPPPPGNGDASGEMLSGAGSDSSMLPLIVAMDKPAAPVAHDFDLVNDLFGGNEAPPVAAPRAEPVAPPAAAPPLASPPVAKTTAPAAPSPSQPAPAKTEPPADKRVAEKKPAGPAPAVSPTADAQRASTKSGTKLPSPAAGAVVPSEALAPPTEPAKSAAPKPSAAPAPAASSPPAKVAPADAAGAEGRQKPADKSKPSPAAAAKDTKPAAAADTAHAPAAAPPTKDASAAPAGFTLPTMWREGLWYLGAGVLGILLAWGAMVVLLQFIGGGEQPVVSVDPPGPVNPPPVDPGAKPGTKSPEVAKPPVPPVDPGVKPPVPMMPPVGPMPKPVDPVTPPTDPMKPPVDPAPADPPMPKPMPDVPVIPAPPERPKPPRIDVNARLADKISEIELPPTALEDFLDFLGSFTTIPISVDPEGLRLAGVGLDVQVAPKGAAIDIRTLLDEALRPHNLGFRVSEGHLIVTCRNLTREGVVPVPYPLTDLAGTDAAQLTSLREMVVEFPLASLGDPAARAKAARLDKGSLLVEAPMKEQFEVLLFLERLRAARGKKPVNPFAMRNPALVRLDLPSPPTSDKLEAIVRVNFAKTIPFAQALSQLKKVGKIRLLVDWRDLEEAAHVGPATEVPLVADNLPLRDALDHLLRPLGLEFRPLEGGAFLIASIAGQQRLQDEPSIEFHKAGELVAADRPAEKLIERLVSSLDDLGLKSGEASLLHYDAPSGMIIARLPRRLQRPFAEQLNAWRGK